MQHENRNPYPPPPPNPIFTEAVCVILFCLSLSFCMCLFVSVFPMLNNNRACLKPEVFLAENWRHFAPIPTPNRSRHSVVVLEATW